MKLWHDDARPAPYGWEWARTNDTAKALLMSGKVVEISLDHDLGYKGPPPGLCAVCGGSGLDFNNIDDPQRCGPCDGDGKIGLDVLYVVGEDDETGVDLARWMAAEGILPAKITVHSMNPVGAAEIAATLRDAGASPLVREWRITDYPSDYL